MLRTQVRHLAQGVRRELAHAVVRVLEQREEGLDRDVVELVEPVGQPVP
jgi:hypothetical protein